MKAILAAVTLSATCLVSVAAAAGPSFSTGGPCASDAASRVPSGSRQVLLSNPSKLHLAATLYRQIDKPDFAYVDAEGAERRSHFPYHYQVFIPPNGQGPIGCTKILVTGGDAAQTFVLQKTDYFLSAPIDNTEDARLSVGFLGDGKGFRLINLHATKAIHVTLDQAGSAKAFDLPPQSVSTATVAAAAGSGAKPPNVTDVRF